MKKILFLIVVLILIPIIFLYGCNNNNSVADEKKIFYYDQSDINLSGIHLTFKCSEYTFQNVNLTIDITAINKQKQEQKFNFKNLKVVNEETGVEYNCSTNMLGDAILQYDIMHNFQINAIIPTSYKVDRYIIKFTISNENYIIKLYELPDNLRVDRIISFKLYTYPNYSTINDVVTVKDNRVAELFNWEDKEHKYYCNNWFTDETRNQSYNWNTKVTSDIILYGLKTTVLSTMSDSSGTYVTKIKYVHNDGILVIDKYSGKVFLSNYSICNNSDVKTIYLPKELKRIYSGNFINMPNLTKIYFEGSESDWNKIDTTSPIPSHVEVIFNSTYKI